MERPSGRNSPSGCPASDQAAQPRMRADVLDCLAGILDARFGIIQSYPTQESSMGITGVSHIAIGVSDMDKSLSFYRDALGMTVTVDRREKSGGGNPQERPRGLFRPVQEDGLSFPL